MRTVVIHSPAMKLMSYYERSQYEGTPSYYHDSAHFRGSGSRIPDRKTQLDTNYGLANRVDATFLALA